MRPLIREPLNDLQREYNALCVKGGGVRGGPVRGKTLDALRHYGRKLNGWAQQATAEHFELVRDANPWHVCFALGLCWGHLAKLTPEFTEAAVGFLEAPNDPDLKVAGSLHLERGPEPVVNSLKGAHTLFGLVHLPAPLPETLKSLGRAQERWLSPVLNQRTRPPYIGSWNATAMFMTALFAQPAATQIEPEPVLPPGGPVFAGLSLLEQGGLTSRAPDKADLDGEGFEPGVLYANNALLAELLRGCADWSLTDVHGGVYLLGTRHPHSNSWIT